MLRAAARRSPLHDRRDWQEISAVNMLVNGTVKPMNDFGIYGRTSLGYPHSAALPRLWLEARDLVSGHRLPTSSLSC